MSKKSSSSSRSGWLLRQEVGGTFTRVYADEAPLAVYEVDGGHVDIPDVSRCAKRFPFEVKTAAAAGHGALVIFAAEGKEEQEAWLTALSAAAVPEAWPGGTDFLKRPQPLLYSIWIARHAATASMGAGSAASAGTAVPSPFPRLPLLKSAPAWQRKALLLQKLRLCTIVFEGVDPTKYLEDRETKRNTLLEIVDFADGLGRQVFTEYRALEDAFTMIRLNLFRALPEAPEPTGNPDEEEEVAFSDPQWPHFSIVYELLLRLVTTDHIDLSYKKKVIDPSFVKQLMALFDSEDPRERDYLKTITHRIYSKLTQRRALVRRVICNVFYEFVYETEKHNGIAEMLEILASIINGFAVPIKDEHKTMLTKALLPLHKAKSIIAYHPQLSYCMALYVAKDHTLTRDVLPGLIKLWPFGNSQKQIMFLNELEDLFEYVMEDDLDFFRETLATRLAKCIGGLHFQVAERTLLLWHSESENHWHESIRTLSASVLDQYRELDPELYARCHEQYEERIAQEDAAAATGNAAESSAPTTAGIQSPAPSAASGAAASPLTGGLGRTASPQSGGSGILFSPTGLHAHKAPAVRAGSSFTDISHADLLPGHKEGVPRKERFVPHSLSMALPASDAAATEGGEE